MKIKFTLLIIALFGLGLFFDSCIDNDKIDELNDELLYKVTESEAFEIAEKLLYLDRTISYPTNEISMENFTVRKKVRSFQTVLNEKNKNVLYVLNYQGGGYVIVAADKRMPLVLAHAEFGDFILEDDLLDNTGLAYWLSDMMDEHEFATTKGYPADVQAEIAEITKELKERDRPVPVLISCPNGSVVFDTLERFPVWGQGDGYNNLLPDTCFNSRGGSYRPPAGCGNTVVGQIMKSLFDHNKYNGIYNYQNELWSLRWHLMPISNKFWTIPESMYEIQQLMLHLGELQNSTYKCTGTSTPMTNILRFFKDSLRMSNAKYGDLNSQVLRTNISNKLPVQLYGIHMSRVMITYTDTLGNVVKKPTNDFQKNGAHTWAVKGFKTLLGCTSKDYLRYLYYMDWGWDGSGNGWFWWGTPNTFENNRRMIYDLGQ
jgi:hypothetical protein